MSECHAQADNETSRLQFTADPIDECRQGLERADADCPHPSRDIACAGRQTHRLDMHFGPPVNADCYCDGQRMRRVQRQAISTSCQPEWTAHGRTTPTAGPCNSASAHRCSFRLQMSLGGDVGKIELRPRFQLRDTRIERLGGLSRRLSSLAPHPIRSYRPSRPSPCRPAHRDCERQFARARKPQRAKVIDTSVEDRNGLRREQSGSETAPGRSGKGRRGRRHSPQDAVSQQHRNPSAPIRHPPSR